MVVLGLYDATGQSLMKFYAENLIYEVLDNIFLADNRSKTIVMCNGDYYVKDSVTWTLCTSSCMIKNWICQILVEFFEPVRRYVMESDEHTVLYGKGLLDCLSFRTRVYAFNGPDVGCPNRWIIVL